MFVKIGKYREFIGPYQIVEKIFFWTEDYPDAKKERRWDYELKYKLGPWLASTWVDTFCNWIHKKKHRKIKVKIHRYDSWNVDGTLSLIIYPLLKQLQETKHGSPFVDDEDVPEHLRSTVAPPKANEWDTDANHHLRWDWVLNEMIWAFEHHSRPDEGDEFWLESPELDLDPKPEDAGQTTIPIRWKKEGVYLHEKAKEHEERKQRAFVLFGKYFRNLWD